MEATPTASANSVMLGRLLYGLAVLTLALTPTQMTFTVKHLELDPGGVGADRCRGGVGDPLAAGARHA